MAEIELRSCPFCGGPAEVVKGAGDHHFFARCQNSIDEEPTPDGVCGMEGRSFDTRAAAGAWWNSREQDYERLVRLVKHVLEREDIRDGATGSTASTIRWSRLWSAVYGSRSDTEPTAEENLRNRQS